MFMLVGVLGSVMFRCVAEWEIFLSQDIVEKYGKMEFMRLIIIIWTMRSTTAGCEPQDLGKSCPYIKYSVVLML